LTPIRTYSLFLRPLRGSTTERISFATNGPAGGIVKLDLQPEALKQLREARRLNLLAQPAAGKRQLLFSVPLDGFAAASVTG
jgi:invasion protein IalB